MSLKFQVEQLALAPVNSDVAREFLEAIGLTQWFEDHVVARGFVYGDGPKVNEANLSFNYQATPEERKPLELEILNYTEGTNWVDAGAGRNNVSHLGMHVTDEELDSWRELMASRGIEVAQEVITQSHTNPGIKDSRRYNYVIFSTKHLIGVDLKFILRLPYEG